MPSVILNKVSEPESLTNESNNVKPLSFSEWMSRHVGISFNDAEKQYKNYINSFYNTTQKNLDNLNLKLRDDYKNLIKRLQIIFQDDEEFQRYKNIDLDSKTDLYIAIPFYAKKLKEIALFYSKKRKELQSKKIEYNLAGSYQGISQILSNNILSKFTRNQQTTFVSENPLITKSPVYSSITNDFNVEIEEMYDTTDYFVLEDNINPFSCIFNNLCYSIFSTPLSAKADPLENLYLCDPSNETVDQLLEKAYKKYLSTDVLVVSGGYYTDKYINFSIPFEQGNNFFYWFSGQTVFDIPEGIYKDSLLNSYDWTYATGASSMDFSDLIFVNAGNFLVKGAWLKDTKYTTVSATMSATITDGKIFKFPFPDFGTSAFGGEWSGPGINDTLTPNKKFFPTEEDYLETQTNITKTYWSNFSGLSTVQPILLQNTTLADFATPSNKYINADKLYVTTKNTDGSHSKSVAWLYKFNQSQIPITVGENKIYFPLQRYENDQEVFFNFYKNYSVELSSLNTEECFNGSIAGLNVNESDIIVKNLTICGPETDAAWLKAVPLDYFVSKDIDKCECDPSVVGYYTGWFYSSGGAQASLSFKCDSSNYVRFIWTGESCNINDVQGFCGFDHDDSCEYKKSNHDVSILDKNFNNSGDLNLLEKWKKCTCGAIIHSPLSHKNTKFDSLGITPDFIVKDTGYPFDFYFRDWRGSDRADYTQSVDSARFYSDFIEKDLGWGKGFWKNQKGGDFVLEKGQSYIFYRSVINNCSFDSPYFVINQKYPKGFVANSSCEQTSFIPVWYKAVKNSSGEWVDSGVVSDMKLNFGDFITYTHRDGYSRTLKRLLYKGKEINTLSGNFIYTSPDDVNISYEEYSSRIDSINFLITIPLQGTNYWGKADYDKQNSNTYLINDYQFNNVFDYLQVTQPPASEILLKDQDVLEFSFSKCSSGCYVWTQDLYFNVYNPIKKWKALTINSCSKSNILNYLNKQITDCYIKTKACENDCSYLEECSCITDCENTKLNITATDEDSDIIFNTELSGSHLFINYFARNTFQQNLSVLDVTQGEKSLFVPLYSAQNIFAETPWRDLLNQKGSNFVIEENIKNLKNKKEIGFYKPCRIGMNRFETFNSETTFIPNTSGFNIYRKDNYFDKPFSKKMKDSKYVTNFSLGQNQGIPFTKNRQTFIPYNNANETIGKPYYGLYSEPIGFSPWNSKTGEWNESEIYKNYRGQYNINCSNDWFTQQFNLTGDVWNWQTDIYGNHFFCVNNSSVNYTVNPSSYNTLFVKLLDGKVYSISQALSSIIQSYNNIEFSI